MHGTPWRQGINWFEIGECGEVKKGYSPISKHDVAAGDLESCAAVSGADRGFEDRRGTVWGKNMVAKLKTPVQRVDCISYSVPSSEPEATVSYLSGQFLCLTLCCLPCVITHHVHTTRKTQGHRATALVLLEGEP